MSRATAIGAALLASLLIAGCDKQPPPPPPPQNPNAKGVADIESPRDPGPPVDSVNYEDGYTAGEKAGEKAAHALAPRSKIPTSEELTVVALAAAGTDTKRGARWQRGYASGYHDGFERVSTGKK